MWLNSLRRFICVNNSNGSVDRIRNNTYGYREREFNKTLLDIAYTPHTVLHLLRKDNPYKTYKIRSLRLKYVNYGKPSRITIHNQVNNIKLKDSFYRERTLVKEELSIGTAIEEYMSAMWMMDSETKSNLVDTVKKHYEWIGYMYRKGNKLIWGTDHIATLQQVMNEMAAQRANYIL